jgi:CRISPR/Cas system-associated protein Csm6
MLAEDVGGMSAEELDEISALRGVMEMKRQEGQESERQRSADEFALGRYVTIEGLAKSAELNGSVAEVVERVQEQEQGQRRLPVRLMEDQKRTLSVKVSPFSFSCPFCYIIRNTE